jgi:hypothetical protein
MAMKSGERLSALAVADGLPVRNGSMRIDVPAVSSIQTEWPNHVNR